MDFVHIVHQLVDSLNWLAKNVPWDAVLASGVLSGLLIGPYKKIKQWFDHHEAVIITLVGILGPTITFAWSYLLHHYPTSPQIVALQGLGIAFLTQPFYIILIKPGVARVGVWITKQVLEAEKLNAGRAALETPAVVPEPQKLSVPIQDFKS